MNQKSLAFTLDSGAVGVVDLLTNSVRRMKTRHTSVSLDKSVQHPSIDIFGPLDLCDCKFYT
jgi:hypothetical protein